MAKGASTKWLTGKAGLYTLYRRINMRNKERVMTNLRQDFTSGNIGGHLIRFSLPFLLANFVQSLYSVADLYIVSKFNGAASIAGVNIGGQITHLVSVFTIGLALGGTVLVAQYFGAKKMRDVSETVGTVFTLLMLLSVCLTVIMLALSRPILTLIQTPPESLSEALSYLRICMLGNVFIFGYNAISAVQRGLGDSKRPLIFVSIACAMNVILDLLLVGWLSMGATGAALATIASQATSMLIAIRYLRRNNFAFDFTPKSFRIHWDKVRMIFRIGLPSSVQNVLVNLSFVLMTTIVNGFGVYAAAAVGIVGKFNSIAIMPASAMGMSVSSMVGQNVGAGLHDRAKKTLLYGIAISMAVGVTMFAIATLKPEWIVGIFSADPEIIPIGVSYLRGFSFDYLCVPLAFCMSGLISGSGHTTVSLITAALTSIILRMPAAWFLSRTSLGVMGIGLAAPIASVGGALLSCLYIVSGRWTRDVTGIRRAEE